MSRVALAAVVSIVALAGCTVASTISSTRGATVPAASVAPDASAAPHGSGETPACLSRELRVHGSLMAQEQVDAVADRVRALAVQQAVNGLSTLSVDSSSLAVNVFWVGAVPAPIAALDKSSHHVRVVFHAARFTAREMLSAMDRVMSATPDPRDASASGLAVGSASACNDGSGIQVDVADRATGHPAKSLPDSYIAAIRGRAGEVPVLVVPGWMPQPATPQPLGVIAG